jgi:serine/threonine protein kinase
MSLAWADPRRAIETPRSLDLWAPRALGPYAVRGVLARGRRSTVYAAHRGGTEVAVKVSTTVDYESERVLLQRLAAPHVIAVHEHGYSSHGFWLAMELAQGGSLRAGIADESTVMRRLAHCASGLALVHRLGWVHRDLKPANLLLRADGGVALGDFGSACPIGTCARRGEIVGTPLYASPELCEGQFATPAADVYALGAVLHEWLTGAPPFPGATPGELAAQHAMAPPPELPGRLSHWQSLLDAMLAKDPASRLPDGQAVLDRLAS